jgi:hypothetical protein
MIARHCDGIGCDTWQRNNSRLPDEFLTVASHDEIWHFCCWDCLLKYAARFEPVEVIEL